MIDPSVSPDDRSPPRPTAPGPPARVCHLSRRRGWIDPENPHRPTSEVNLLAIALGSPVWTMGTAWETLFHELIPLPVARAFRSAMVRARLSDDEVRALQGAAERLGIALQVVD